jgi:hypothetical protein
MDLHKILEAIKDVRNRIVREGAINNPHLLSERMAELALFNHMLSDFLADLRLEAKRLLSATYERFKATMSATAAMNAAKLDNAVLQAEHASERVDMALRHTSNLITALQSHIKAKMNELSQMQLTT